MMTKTEARATLAQLHRAGFIGQSQRAAIQSGFESEEQEYFLGLVGDLATTIGTMPKTYEQDGLGSDAMVHLHYFYRGMDWYITEKDMEPEQLQAFGLANLGYGGELGYIWIGEITASGAELDLFWTPKKLSEIAGYDVSYVEDDGDTDEEKDHAYNSEDRLRWVESGY